MAEEDSFLALVHIDGEIKHRSREGVKFTDKNPTNVFITTRTRLVDLQHSIQRRICRDGRNRLGVKYGCFAIKADEDLQHDPEAHQVVSSTFGIYHEAEAADGVGDLGDTRSFGEIATVVAEAPHAVPVLPVERDPEPLVDEALRADDSDDESAFFEGNGDSNDDIGPVPTLQGGESSSGTKQYPPHLSNLNLDALFGPRRAHDEPSSGTQDSQESSNQAKFEVGQTFMNKEVAVIAVKNYSIRRGVEYKVMESDHAKYLGRCKQFGQGCNWLIRLTL
ncbi:hypothetical protein PIB30_073724 [Stylosanthes scabra]|uniref:Transposase MuDR plant domain-containing protein n=1 Tax=Stylosanthes scabra TaxID=79078 RepID=A0ABU6WQH6_9FABA|nr:hypothetical protein [Stylosanthes scabra]